MMFDKIGGSAVTARAISKDSLATSQLPNSPTFFGEKKSFWLLTCLSILLQKIISLRKKTKIGLLSFLLAYLT